MRTTPALLIGLVIVTTLSGCFGNANQKQVDDVAQHYAGKTSPLGIPLIQKASRVPRPDLPELRPVRPSTRRNPAI